MIDEKPMKRVFTLAIPGEGVDEARCLEDALVKLAERVSSPNEAPSLHDEFYDVLIDVNEDETLARDALWHGK